MDLNNIIKKTTEFVHSQLEGTESGHSWFHVERVWKMARHIQEQEQQGDLLIIELAALLHDIADPKFNGGDEEEGGRIACNFPVTNGLEKEKADHIQSIIKNISFKGGIGQGKIDSIEFRIVQDADRLDAMGAIGIARAFNYGGFMNRSIYDPEIPPREYGSSKEYYRSEAPTINHFYEKLLKLKDLMNTESGKKIAAERHRFMEKYLDQFFRDWNPLY